MEFFRINRDIPFMRHALAFNIVSLLTFLAAVFFLATRGLHFSIEFTGGTVIEVGYAQAADVAKVRGVVEGLKFGEVQVQNFGSSRDVLIRLPVRGDVKQTEVVSLVFAALCSEQGGKIVPKQMVTPQGEAISKQVCDGAAAASGTAPGSSAVEEPVRLQRSEFVGPQVGRELAEDGAKALAFVIVGIMLYLAFRFEWKFSVAAIVANLHDVIIILGFFAYFQWEFSLSVLAAVLAVLGYSVNESVVIFDRIREAFRRWRKMDTRAVIDHAITSTISRTIITHGSTQMMVLSMLMFGGPTLHYFAVALTIGILFGIYSSVFVAAAIAMWLGVTREDMVKASPREGDPDDPNAGAVV
ncbi:MAG: protein translocase subunit SecF [Burkholderiaceae bacterium]